MTRCSLCCRHMAAVTILLPPSTRIRLSVALDKDVENPFLLRLLILWVYVTCLGLGVMHMAVILSALALATTRTAWSPAH